MDVVTIFHPLHGYGLCYGSYSRSKFLADCVQPANGTLVDCRMCGRPGVIPDEGHELKFLPPGTERTPDGKSFILRSKAPD